MELYWHPQENGDYHRADGAKCGWRTRPFRDPTTQTERPARQFIVRNAAGEEVASLLDRADPAGLGPAWSLTGPWDWHAAQYTSWASEALAYAAFLKRPAGLCGVARITGLVPLFKAASAAA